MSKLRCARCGEYVSTTNDEDLCYDCEADEEEYEEEE
jgi:formylmethanofuran dehydrogenase subunit E